MIMDTSPKNLSLAPPSPHFFSVCRCCENLEQRFQGSLDKIFRRRASLQNIQTNKLRIDRSPHIKVVAVWLETSERSIFFRPKSCTSASPRHLTFLGGSWVGVGIVDMLTCGFRLLTHQWRRRYIIAKLSENMHSTSVHPSAFLVYWVSFRLQSRCDWNSPTRCHTKTWYVKSPQNLSPKCQL